MDKNGKMGGKISIIDIFVLLIVIVAAFGISMRFLSAPAKNAKETVRVSFVVEVEGIRKYSVDALGKKGNVIDIKQKYLVGEITDFKSEPQKRESFDANGEIVYAEVPERYTARVTIESDCKQTENGYYVGDNTELAVGSDIQIATKYANSSGKIISITELN